MGQVGCATTFVQMKELRLKTFVLFLVSDRAKIRTHLGVRPDPITYFFIPAASPTLPGNHCGLLVALCVAFFI